jgi:hypothetical protein
MMAFGYAIKGDRAGALTALEEAVAQQDEQICNIIRIPVFAGMHNDPRYLEVLRRINLQP